LLDGCFPVLGLNLWNRQHGQYKADENATG